MKSPIFGTMLVAVALMWGAMSFAYDKPSFLELARSGWNYSLRTTMVGRDLSIAVRINGRDMSGAALCIVGEKPSAQSLAILTAFRGLSRHIFGKPLPMRYAGQSAQDCGAGRVVVLRLYSGNPPSWALTRDLDWLNQAFDLGLPQGRDYMASSPAMAQTFFGRRGAATHIMVQQKPQTPATPETQEIETTFFKSILIEELYQSFTFGMDVLMFKRHPVFMSKLQEVPLNIHRLPWGSTAFMSALLTSNPVGLCAFDVFMMHAVALAPVDQTTDPEFISYIDTEFDHLSELTSATLTDPQFNLIVDPGCHAVTR